jgi:epidermal growth factor receptor
LFSISVCSGTDDGLETIRPINFDLHYQIQSDRYTNCTFIDGNLEITWISNDKLDFLKHIREVSGYILFHHANVKDVILPNLRVIRGTVGKLPRMWWAYSEHALFVSESTINTLQLPSLRVILHGSVVTKNTTVCYWHTIKWDEILESNY